MDFFSSLSGALAASIATSIIALFKAISFVHEGEMGIRLRFGRAVRDRHGHPKVIPPGFVFMIPFLDTLKRHHVRQQTLKLDHQQVMIAHGLIFNVSAIVIFRVKDIYRALFEIDELDSSLTDLAMAILRDVLANKEYEKLSCMQDISKELLEALREKASEWGAEFIGFRLTDCAPTSETAPLVNVKIGVEMKIRALQHASEIFKIDLLQVPPTLAAVLVGTPLTAAIGSVIPHDAKGRMHGEGHGSEKSGFMSTLVHEHAGT